MPRKNTVDESTNPDAFIEEICARMEGDLRVRRSLPGNGRLHLDRSLPFLCVYRQPGAHPDAGTRALVTGEAANLVASAAETDRTHLSALVTRLAETACRRFGGFLIVEVWSVPPADYVAEEHPETGEIVLPAPAFRVLAPGPRTPYRTVDTLRAALGRLKVHRRQSRVSAEFRARPHPPGLPALISAGDAKQIGCYWIGLEVLPIYRDPETGETFPSILRAMRRGLGRALKQGFFTFAQMRTRINPQHYYALGRRTFVKAVKDVDSMLAHIGNQFDFMLQVTPLNAEQCWSEFKKSRFDKLPRFEYRPLTVEPTLLKRQLFQIPIERVEDPTIAHIYRQRQDELDRKITMLADVGTPRFLHGSLQVYGGVSESLLGLAEELLRILGPRSREDSAGGYLNAQMFAERARAEIAFYRENGGHFAANVFVRDDMFSGMLSSGGHLLVGKRVRIPASRAEALLHHEVGTHLLTYYNGRTQPLQLLYLGLAGYDALQEGLAVLSEYLSGGLSRPRLRLLAGRVVAVHGLVGGATFLDTFRRLEKTYGFAQRTAYTITMRVYRGGGLTKDAVYLRGLVEILDYIGRGGDLEPLFVGKMAVDQIPVIQELLHRGVLQAGPFRPRYMNMPEITDKLARLRQRLTVVNLITGATYEDGIRRQRRDDRVGELHDDAAGDGRHQSRT